MITPLTNRTILYSLLLWLATLTASLAQGVRGRVVDVNKSPIPGATVVVMSSNVGATTDADGVYTIRLQPGTYSLRVSFVGYDNQTVPVTVRAGETTVADVSLAETASKLGELVVIGSRAATARTNIQTTVPVDVISTKEMKNFSQVDLGQVLNFVAPSFNSNRQTVTDGTDHIDPASLRGLGPDQTLVLVNGKRRHTSSLVNINGSVGRGAVGTDMNVIPVAAVERIEVLRDGAAAQYGSDAIAGVINVVLKKNYQGLTASLMTGGSFTNMTYQTPNIAGGTDTRSVSLHDGKVFQFDISKGFRLGSRGFLTVSGQIVDRERTNRSGEDNAPTIYLGASGGFPATTALPAAQRPQLLADDATLVRQRGYDRRNMVIGNSSARNYGVFANGSVPLGQRSELYFTGGVTSRSGTGYGNNRIPVSRTQQPLTADGTLYYPDGFLPAIKATIGDQSLLAGFKTKFGQWNMDLSNTFGRNQFRFDVENSANASLANSSTPQTSFYAGTLSFDQNTTNLDFSRLYERAGGIRGLNLAFGGEFRRDHFVIEPGEVNSYSGDANKRVPLAPLSLTGTSPGTTTPLPGAQVFPGYQPDFAVDKSRTNVSLYGDVEGELFNRLLLDVAGRYENYSDFGSALTGKLATRLRLSDAFNLRGAISTGFRAPSLHQRYFQNISTQFVSGNPSNTLTVNNDNPIARQVIGVDALRPEKSVNYTLGLTGRIGRNFTLTVDAYQIDITDRIVYSGGFSRTLLGFSATDYPGVNLVRFFANAANTRTRGIDIVGTERVTLGAARLSVSLAMNFNKNLVTGINSTPLIDNPANNEGKGGNPDNWFKNILFDRQQRGYIESFLPRDKQNLIVDFTLGKFNANLRMARFGKAQFLTNLDPYAKDASGNYYNSQFARDANGTPYIDQTYSPVVYTDLTLGYGLTKQLTLQVGANNLFDVYPDQIYLDPRNALGSVDYNSGRDQSNRGRFLYGSNQGGFNGRFLFGRLSFSM